MYPGTDRRRTHGPRIGSPTLGSGASLPFDREIATTIHHLLDRRTLLADLGHGAIALAVVGIAGCGPTVLASLAPTLSTAPPPTPSFGSAGVGTPRPTGGAASAPPVAELGAAG